MTAGCAIRWIAISAAAVAISAMAFRHELEVDVNAGKVKLCPAPDPNKGIRDETFKEPRRQNATTPPESVSGSSFPATKSAPNPELIP
jgi:hypothetical protein